MHWIFQCKYRGFLIGAVQCNVQYSALEEYRHSICRGIVWLCFPIYVFIFILDTTCYRACYYKEKGRQLLLQYTYLYGSVLESIKGNNQMTFGPGFPPSVSASSRSTKGIRMLTNELASRLPIRSLGRLLYIINITSKYFIIIIFWSPPPLFLAKIDKVQYNNCTSELIS
jgi:hypothetical protein